MRAGGIVMALSIVIAAGGFFAACDTQVGPSPIAAFIRGDPVIRDVEIVGPQSVAPGQTAKFALIAHLHDHSSRDVTNEARWSSKWGHVLISQPGRVTGLERGEDLVEVNLERHYMSTQLMVLPVGTYRLSGQVKQAEVLNRALVGAQVEVMSGVGVGLTTNTDSWGNYCLYGVSGETGLRITKDGYQPTARTLVVAGHLTYTIEVPLLEPLGNLSGNRTR